VTLELVPLAPGGDAGRLADELAPAFAGDPAVPREILSQTFALLKRDPRPHPWGCYLVRSGGVYVGTCAFKSAPDAEGTVEIAYSTFPAYEGCGIATRMAGELTRIASDAGAPLVIAHTLPEENASNRALRRNGFTFAGTTDDPEDGPVWRWEKRARLS